METLRLETYSSTKPSSRQIFNPLSSLETTLNSIIPQEGDGNKLTGTRRRLGEVGKKLSDEKLNCIVTDFQYLIDAWLDEFEANIFEGKTLKELLGDKEYATTNQK